MRAISPPTSPRGSCSSPSPPARATPRTRRPTPPTCSPPDACSSTCSPTTDIPVPMASPALPDPADSTARLLALVLERAPRTPDDLRAALGLVEPELTPLLAALERHGLVAWD